MSSKTCERVNY